MLRMARRALFDTGDGITNGHRQLECVQYDGGWHDVSRVIAGELETVRLSIVANGDAVMDLVVNSS